MKLTHERYPWLCTYLHIFAADEIPRGYHIFRLLSRGVSLSSSKLTRLNTQDNTLSHSTLQGQRSKIPLYQSSPQLNRSFHHQNEGYFVNIGHNHARLLGQRE